MDIATTEKQGVRLEFWGDEITSIRNFDIASQKSTEKIDKVKIYPAHEFVLVDGLEKIVEKLNKFTNTEEDIEEIREGNYISKIDRYFDIFYEKQETFLDYLKNDYLIFIDEIGKIKARSENIKKDNENLIKTLVEKNRIVPQALENTGDYLSFLEEIKNLQTIYLEKQDIGFVDKQSMHAKRNGYSFSYREVNFFRSSMDLCLEEIQEATNEGKTVVILCGKFDNVKKVKELVNKKIKKALSNIEITEGALSAGFESYDFKLLVISLEDIFENNKRNRIIGKEFKQAENIIFQDLKIGDYIVHKTSGIGQFVGIDTVEIEGETKDYIKIKYRDEGLLYIPTSNLDSIRKYIGVGDNPPNLNKLGTKEWAKAKEKAKSNLREIAKDLIMLYAKREKAKGYMFSKDTEWQKQFEQEFPFIETEDQLRSIEEMKKDMESEKPMDRLLCGDVGYGKTEVALRGAFKAVMDQKQVAYLAPTTILSNQQYKTFTERLKNYPIRIALLNRFISPSVEKRILKQIKLGEIDIVIGTHKILNEKVEFKDLGLLIIDEEHRFRSKT